MHTDEPLDHFGRQQTGRTPSRVGLDASLAEPEAVRGLVAVDDQLYGTRLRGELHASGEVVDALGERDHLAAVGGLLQGQGVVVARVGEGGDPSDRSIGHVADRRREPLVVLELGPDQRPALTFVAAELTSDDGWAAAVADCDFVLHVASPVHLEVTDNEDEVIVPARAGALRVVRAARDAGVKRVVLTSAFHAVGYGHPHTEHVFTEDDCRSP